MISWFLISDCSLIEYWNFNLFCIYFGVFGVSEIGTLLQVKFKVLFWIFDIWCLGLSVFPISDFWCSKYRKRETRLFFQLDFFSGLSIRNSTNRKLGIIYVSDFLFWLFELDFLRFEFRVLPLLLMFFYCGQGFFTVHILCVTTVGVVNFWAFPPVSFRCVIVFF